MKLIYTPLRNRLSSTAFLILCVFFIHSCKKDEPTIGLGVLPAGEGLGISQDVVTPSSTIYKADSIRTDELIESFIGNYNDPQFGLAKTEFYCQLELPGNNFDLGDPSLLELDSVILSLKTTQNVLGSLEAQNFSVFELDEAIYSDSIYYSDRSVTYLSDDLVKVGESTIPISNASVISRGDFVVEELRIPLENSLGQLLIDRTSSNPEDFTNDESFQEFFKGLSIVSTIDDGSIMGIDPNNGLSALILHYRDLSGDEPDTLTVSFQIDNSSAYFNYFERDYSTSVFGDFDSSLSTDEKVYLQGIDGLMAELELTDFPVEKVGNENLSLAKAELVLPVNTIENESYSPPAVLFLSTGSSRDTLKVLEDQLFGLSIGGFYEQSRDAYIFDCPLHIQNVISESADLESLWISVNPPERLRSFFNTTSTYNRGLIDQRRVVLNGPQFNPQDISENMRLVLTYSE